jgi:hypothetical protein
VFNTVRPVLLTIWAVTIVVGAAFTISPVKVTVLGTEATCGLAPVAWIQYLSSDQHDGTTAQEQTNLAAEAECSHEGAQRTIVGLVIVGGALIGFFVTKRTVPKWNVPPPPAAF